MIKELKSKFLKSLKSGKLNVFLLFLVLSFMFLILSKLTKEYTKTITFDIEPIHAKQNYVILKDTTQKFDITLTTYGFKLMNYYLFKPSLTLDLANIKAVDKKYIWTSTTGLSHINTQFSDNVKILAVSPDSVIFPFDINNIKKVPILLKSEISFVQGYDSSDGFQLNPDSINIIGPKIITDTINSVSTSLLKLNDVKTDIDAKLNIVLPDSSNSITYSHDKIEVKAHVEKFTEGKVAIPINVLHVPKDKQINYFPKEVTVKYYTSLSNFKFIHENDFIIECNFNDLDSTATYLEPKLVKYPKNVKNIRLLQKQIDFIISK